MVADGHLTVCAGASPVPCFSMASHKLASSQVIKRVLESERKAPEGHIIHES
jgi:hypothetical protein